MKPMQEQGGASTCIQVKVPSYNRYCHPFCTNHVYPTGMLMILISWWKTGGEMFNDLHSHHAVDGVLE